MVILNPYDPPEAVFDIGVEDRTPTRESLSELIRSFLASEISAFAFDEHLDTFRDSNDPIIRYVVDSVWYHYDDCSDHFVCFSKQQWDFFQRLLLALASDCRIETKSCLQWSFRQLIAAVALYLFAVFAIPTGWGEHLFLLSIPFGCVSIALSFWRLPDHPFLAPRAVPVSPFATYSDLVRAYRKSGFRKTRFPTGTDARALRSPGTVVFLWLQAYVTWLVLSPIPLLFQALPVKRTETRIVAT
jgi:hypothetical protein